MKVYLIRHTEVALSRSICYGSSDIELADSFNEEKKIVSEKLQKIVKRPIYFSSPLKRCRMLAQYLHGESINQETKSLPDIFFDDRLKEIYMGEWELKPWKDLDINQLAKWGDGFTTQKPHSGESYQDMQNRAMEFWFERISDKPVMNAAALVQTVRNHIDGKNILNRLSHKDIVIVTHGGVVRTLICGILGLPLENSFALEPAKGGISCIEITNLGRKLSFFNF